MSGRNWSSNLTIPVAPSFMRESGSPIQNSRISRLNSRFDELEDNINKDLMIEEEGE